MIEKTTRIARQIQVHFFILASIDFPLFLPKKVSLEPPNASIPDELLGCNKTRMIAVKAEIAIKIIMVTLSTICTVLCVGLAKGIVDANKFINFIIMKSSCFFGLQGFSCKF